MKNILPILICLLIAFVCPIIISWEYKFLSGHEFGRFGTALSMICCMLFAVGIYPRLNDQIK